MADRDLKRKQSDYSSLPPNKRANLGGGGSGTPSAAAAQGENLLQFKNKQLGDKVKELKDEIASLEAQNRRFMAQQAAHDDELSCVRRHWEQLDCDLKLTLSRAGDPQPLAAGSPSGSFVERLCGPLPSPDGLDAAILQRCAFTRSVVERVLTILEQQRQRQEQLVQQLATTAPEAAGAELLQLQERMALQDGLLNEVQVQHRAAEARAALAEDRLAAAEQSVTTLRRERDDATEDLAMERKRARKAQERAKELEDRVVQLEADAALQTPVAGAAGTPTNGAGAAGVPTASSEQVEALQTEVEVYSELAAARLREVEQLKNDNVEISRKLQTLQVEASGPLLNERVTNTRLYIDLYHKLQFTDQELTNERVKYNQLQTDIKQMQKARRDEEERLKAAEAAKLEALRKDLHDAELAVKRSKDERDNFELKLKMREALSQNDMSKKEYESLIDSLKGENKKLKGEVERIRAMTDRLRQSIEEEEEDEDEEKEIASLSLEEVQRRLKRTDRLLKHLNSTLDAQKQDSEQLMGEIDNIGRAFEESHEQNQRLVRQLSEKEDVNRQLMTERIKGEQLQSLLHLEKESMAQKLSALEHKSNAQAELLMKYDERAKAMDEALGKLKENQLVIESTLENSKRLAREHAQTAHEFRSQLEQNKQQAKEYKQRADDLMVQLEETKFKTQRLEEKSNEYKVKLTKMKRTASGVEDAPRSDDVAETMRKLLNCGVCSKRQKSVVINKCFHTFCKECIDSNLAVRNRKCPGCGLPYSATDVHPIYM